MTTDVLVACPAAERKHYSFDRWAAATAGYPRMVAVDEHEYAERLRAEYPDIEVVEFPAVSTRRMGDNAIYGPRHAEAWAAILGNTDARFILSLESDVIPPKDCDIVSLMLDNYDPSFDFVCHAYPWRYPHRKGLYAYETGCTLATAEVWRKALRMTHPDHGIYETVRHADDFRCKDIHLIELEHLGEGDDRFVT